MEKVKIKFQAKGSPLANHNHLTINNKKNNKLLLYYLNYILVIILII